MNWFNDSASIDIDIDINNDDGVGRVERYIIDKYNLNYTVQVSDQQVCDNQDINWEVECEYRATQSLMQSLEKYVTISKVKDDRIKRSRVTATIDLPLVRDKQATHLKAQLNNTQQRLRGLEDAYDVAQRGRTKLLLKIEYHETPVWKRLYLMLTDPVKYERLLRNKAGILGYER